jgi:hypothetical protein
MIGNIEVGDVSDMFITDEIQNLMNGSEFESLNAEIVQAELLFDEELLALFGSDVKKHIHVILMFLLFGLIFNESVRSSPAPHCRLMHCIVNLGCEDLRG